MTKFSKDTKIFIAGHNGMVGSACWRLFKKRGYLNLIGKSSKELDLRDQKAVLDFFKKNNPEVVIDAAARVGGIWANNEYPYEFLLDNMQIQNSLIQNSLNFDVKKFIFLGSSCIYPKMSTQPIKEECLLTGPLEETNQWYAIAKISGVKLIESIRKQFEKDYISLMPTNLYGPGDNYNLKTSHVLPALIRKFHEAKINNKDVELWRSGKPLREFLFVEDLAEAILFALQNNLDKPLYNVGSGEEISICKLAKKIQKHIGHKSEIIWNSTMPDGTPKKLLDSSKINSLGFRFKTNLDNGIKITYQDFLNSNN
jgi:GDP-L-fucose synthase